MKGVSQGRQKPTESARSAFPSARNDDPATYLSLGPVQVTTAYGTLKPAQWPATRVLPTGRAARPWRERFQSRFVSFDNARTQGGSPWPA